MGLKKLIVIMVVLIIVAGTTGYAVLQQYNISPPTGNIQTPTPSPTVTTTPTFSPSPIFTATPTSTLALTPSPTVTPTTIATPTPTSSATATATLTVTPSPSATSAPTPSPTPTPVPTPTPIPPTVYPLSFNDDANRSLTVATAPARIISLAPSTTEMLFGLGLADKIVGTVNYTGYDITIHNTIRSKNITNVGTFNKVNVELVTGLQPDLILASGTYQLTLASKFAEQGKLTVMLNPIRFSGILDDLTLLGKITDLNVNASALVKGMQSRADAIAAKTSGLTKTSVYVEYYADTSGYSSYGGKSYINELISMAGGINVFAGFNGEYVTTSTEEILKANPSIIVISKGVMSTIAGITPDSIKARAGWSSIGALQNNKIYEINEALLTLWGPRTVDGLEALAKVIHPEAFPT